MKNSKFDRLFNTIMEEAKKPTNKKVIKENSNDDPLEMVINMLKNQDWGVDLGNFDVEDIADEFCCKYEEDGGDWNNLNEVKKSLRKYIKDVVIGGNV